MDEKEEGWWGGLLNCLTFMALINSPVVSLDSVCVCVDGYYLRCGDIDVFTHSHCGDRVPYGDQNAILR